MAHQSRTVLVTGAAGGLGRVIAERFLEEGANVAIIDLSDKLIEAVNAELGSKHGDRLLVVKGSITDPADVDKVFEATLSKFGKLDYLVNNAGIMDKFDPVTTVTREMWDKVIAINLTGPMLMLQKAVNIMLKNEGPLRGAIVNVSSIAGTRGASAGAAYTASKHGVLGLTKNTAATFNLQGIRCNAIMPGGMNTNIFAHFAEGFNMEGMNLSRRTFNTDYAPLLDISKVASTVSFLCSDAAACISGACIPIDGGVTAA